MTQYDFPVDERIEELESEIFEKKRELAELRRELQREEVGDYSFQTWERDSIALSELFGDRDDLLIVHNMGKSCSYCTLWADEYNGAIAHLEDRAAFYVVSPDPPDVQREFARSRGWEFRMVSDVDGTFTADMGYRDDERDMALPGVSSFHLEEDGTIVRVAHRAFGPGDDFCATWHFFDLLDGGRGDWSPKYSYD